MRLLSQIAPILALLFPLPAFAKNGIIYTDSVTYCTEAKAVVVDQFDIAYHQSNNSVTFSFSLEAVEANLNVSANIYANAYGMDIVNQTIELCSFFEGVICPLPQVNFTGFGTYPIPTKYTSKIPGIAYTVPNLEGYARIQLIRDGSGEVAACLQATLANGKSTKQLGVAIGTGVFTLLALLIGLFHTGAVNSPSPAQYRWFDILYLYQSAVATGLMHLNYPLVYSNFVQNFAWSFALFYSSAMQSTIDKMRAKTGGHLDSNVYSGVQTIDRKLSPFNLAVDVNTFESTSDFKTYLSSIPSSLDKRSMIKSVVEQNATTELDTGLPVYVETNNIPQPNAYDTIFFWYLAFIAIALVFHIFLFAVVLLCDRARSRRMDGWATRLRRMWWGFCSGNALRLCLIGFLPIWIFAFWQFHIGDSHLSLFFAVFGIFITFVPLAAVFTLSILRSRRPSSTAPMISPLYTSYRWFHSVGALYRAYRPKMHFFWFAPLVLAMIARAGFIAFGNSSAWAQVIGNVVVEAIVLLSLLACRPHKDRKGDWLAPFLSFCRLASFGLLIAFIPSMNVKAIPRTIIGFVIIVLFGVPTILLLLGLIWNTGYGYWWRRHTHRIEDGLEVERFVASDDDLQRPDMVDANNFVSGPASTSPRNTYDPSLHRRTSIIEPISPENVYEPSMGSRPHSGYYGSRPTSGPTSPTSADHRQSYAAAYERAAGGGGGISEENGMVGTRPSSRGTSRLSDYQTPMSGLTGNGYYTPRTGDTPGENRWSRDQYFPNNGTRH